MGPSRRLLCEALRASLPCMRCLRTPDGHPRPASPRRVDLLPRWIGAIVATSALLGCDGCRSRPHAVPLANHETSIAEPTLADVDDETVDAVSISTALPLPTRARLVASLSHACVVTPTGRLRCWGRNASGELGDGSREARSPASAADVPIDRVARVTLGSGFTCVLRVDRSVWCWGSGPIGPAWGQSLVPKQMLGLAGVRDLLADGSALCAIQDDDVRCWGRNRTPGSTVLPTLTLDDAPVALSVGPVAAMCPPHPQGIAFARRTGQVVLYEGPGKFRELSSMATRSTSAALRALRCSNFDRLWMLTADGVVTLSEETGAAKRRVRTLELPPIRTLGANHGELRSAVGLDGRLYGWGENTMGELADGTTISRSAPVAIDGLSGVSTGTILTGGGCAVAGRGLWCWGDRLTWILPTKKPVEHLTALW